MADALHPTEQLARYPDESKQDRGRDSEKRENNQDEARDGPGSRITIIGLERRSNRQLPTIMKHFSWLAGLLAVMAEVSACQLGRSIAAEQSGAVFVNVTLINPGVDRKSARTVVVRGSKIESISDSARGAPTAGSAYDGSYALPGLIDMHVHPPSPGDWSGFVQWRNCSISLMGSPVCEIRKTMRVRPPD